MRPVAEPRMAYDRVKQSRANKRAAGAALKQFALPADALVALEALCQQRPGVPQSTVVAQVLCEAAAPKPPSMPPEALLLSCHALLHAGNDWASCGIEGRAALALTTARDLFGALGDAKGRSLAGKRLEDLKAATMLDED